VKSTPEVLALQSARGVCQGHVEALTDALADLGQRRLQASDLASVGKQDKRLLDQFAYRYTRLQDDMGSRLMPGVLRALGEDVAAMPALDRFNRLEQLGWLPSAEEWSDLRRLRNEFAHEYPEAPLDRFQRLSSAIEAAQRLLQIMARFDEHIRRYFPGIGSAA
jgi:hypothetical protein